jgi:HSP20 family protein
MHFAIYVANPNQKVNMSQSFASSLNNIFSILESLSNVENSSTTEGKRVIKPTSHISRDNGEYTVLIEMPGVKKEDISLALNDNKLQISAEQKIGKEPFTYESSFTLFPTIDKDNIEAAYLDGVLKVTLKSIRGSSRNINIQ